MANNRRKDLISELREQISFLRDLGVDSLAVEFPERRPQVSAPEQRQQEAIRRARPAPDLNSSKIEISSPKRLGSRLAVLPSLANRPRPKTKPEAGNRPPLEANLMQPTQESQRASDGPLPLLSTEAETIDSIRNEIGDCKRCPLHLLGRKQIVHTTGNFSADLMFIGEAPGADEDEQGLPFVGRAGQLLTKIIESIGLRREEVCIGNIVRCRPPNNRKPEPEEVSSCRPFILREIAVVKPKVIVVLGATAAHNLLQVNAPISQLRGRFQDYFGLRVMPTFHPAYLLRDPNKKREVWEDMKLVRGELMRLTNQNAESKH